MAVITWSASNDRNYMQAPRGACTIDQAIADAIEYVEDTLQGQGTYAVCADDEVVAEGVRTIHTGMQWQTARHA